MGKAFSSALEVWDTAPIVEFYQQIPMHLRGEEMDYEERTVIKLAGLYLNHYEQHEREIELPGMNLNGAKFEGYIDGRLDYTNLVEDKLKGQWTDNNAEALKTDDQVTTYIAMYSLHTGIKPEELTLHYRVTRKPALRLKKGESYYDLGDRMEADIDKRPEHYLIEVDPSYTSRTSYEVQEWWDDTRQVAKDIVADVAAGVWPKSPGSCMQYGGLCSMWDICTAKSDEEASLVIDAMLASTSSDTMSKQ